MGLAFLKTTQSNNLPSNCCCEILHKKKEISQLMHKMPCGNIKWPSCKRATYFKDDQKNIQKSLKS